MKKLIAYYSRAGENYFSGAHRTIAVGNTEKAARLLAELTGAELFHIEQKVPYSDNYDTCVAEARRDLRASARPELTALPESLDDYDEIYLGYPNYCGTMPMAVYTFLEHYDWQGKTIHPFCTNEGSGLSNTEQDIRRAAKGARVARGLLRLFAQHSGGLGQKRPGGQIITRSAVRGHRIVTVFFSQALGKIRTCFIVAMIDEYLRRLR